MTDDTSNDSGTGNNTGAGNGTGNGGDSVSDAEAQLLAALRSALGRDTPPAGLTDRAIGLAAYFDVDRELDNLLHAAATEQVGVRGAADGDRLTFELDNGSVACELALGGDRVAGQVLAGDVTTVDLVGLDGDHEVSPVDALGRFGFRAEAGGPLRLRLDDGSGRRLLTDWFVL